MRNHNDNSCEAKVIFYPFIFVLLIALVSCGPKTASQKKVRINTPSVEVLSIEAREDAKYTRVEITANRSFSYNILNHYEPLALVLEIPGAVYKGVPDKLIVNRGAVSSINLKDAPEKGMKQIVIQLSKRTNYQVSKKGRSLFVDIDVAVELPHDINVGASHQEKAEKGKIFQEKRKKLRQEYVIGGKDVLEITVYDEPDLNRKVRVSNKGYISFPLIGDVKVAELTAAQVEKKLESLLKGGYIVNPQVSINILEYRSSEIYVLGAINKPGAYPLMGENSLLEALSRAGGIATTQGGIPASKELIVLREESGAGVGIKYIRINLDKLLSQGDLSLNLTLKDNDTIYVPQADSIFVFGEVNSPGSFMLLQKKVTVLEAITMAGGLTKYAASNRTKVITHEGGTDKTLKVDIKAITKGGDRSKDVVLKPGDVVFVPQSYF